MAVEGVMVRDGNSVAGADFSNTAALAGPNGSGQFLAVKQSLVADRTVLLQVAAGTGEVYGILQNKPRLGEAADVCISGISKAVYGGTVAAGDNLMTDTSGRLITATTGGTKWVVAKAIVAGVLGDIGTVEVMPKGILLA
jgi:hypothetical protein